MVPPTLREKSIGAVFQKAGSPTLCKNWGTGTNHVTGLPTTAFGRFGTGQGIGSNATTGGPCSTLVEYVHIYIYIYIQVYIYFCIYVCIDSFIYTCIYIYSLCVCLCACVSLSPLPESGSRGSQSCCGKLTFPLFFVGQQAKPLRSWTLPPSLGVQLLLQEAVELAHRPQARRPQQPHAPQKPGGAPLLRGKPHPPGKMGRGQGGGKGGRGLGDRGDSMQ